MKLKEIISLFFKLGLTAFGGPAAHMAMMHKEVVENRKWISDKHFLDLVGATSLIPGPNSTEMVMHCGHERAGVKGLFTAGISFIFPACLLTGLLAYLYTKAISINNIDNYIVGLKAVVLILIFQALQKLWKKAVKSYLLGAIAIFVLALGFTGISEIAALFLGALIGFILTKTMNKNILTSVDVTSIFLSFFKIGSVLFGSGYVLIGYLQHEIVENHHWLNSSQIADAIAFGQFTPGPLLSTATFIGYLLGETNGAIVASIGIFLPSFLFVLILNPLIPKMRDSKNFSILLDCVNAGAIGLMAYALYPLSMITIKSPVALTTLAICILIQWKIKNISSIKLVSFGLVCSCVLTQASTYIS